VDAFSRDPFVVRFQAKETGWFFLSSWELKFNLCCFDN
jgi:hypothetical protein